MQSIIQKLNMLKSVQPSEKWVVEARKEVLSKTPVFYDLKYNYTEKSMFDLSFNNLNNLFVNKLAISFATVIFVLLGSFSASYASKSSLPGDTLYSVKMASESIELAVASEDNKAEIEIKQAGKRLEEAVEVSKNPSDIHQGEKLKQLVANFEEKINNAQDGLTKIENDGKKAEIAKVINVQTEKYTEVLAETNENLTVIVQNDVSEKFVSATDSNNKVNLDSLAVRVEVMTDEDKDEITAIIKEKVEEKAALNEEEDNSDIIVPEIDQDITEEEILNDISDIEEEKIEENSEIFEDVENSENIEEIIAEDITIEETKIELLKDLDDLSESNDESGEEVMIDEDISVDGEVKGVSDSEEQMPIIEDEEILTDSAI